MYSSNADSRAASLGRKHIVVSLTPLPLSADSRTLKQVTSVGRLGVKSIAVEGKRSPFPLRDAPFELISINARATDGSSALRRSPDDEAASVGTTASDLSIVRLARHLAIYFNQYFFQILQRAPRADIYYLHAFYQFPAVWLLCLWHRAKMIYDAHDFYSQMEDELSYSSYWKNWIMPLERTVERLCVWFAADVVTVNEGIAALMRERFGREPVILRNAHDARLDRQPARTIREAIGLAPDAFLVVSIGHWKKGMAVEQMLDALAELPARVHLAFLGDGYPPLEQATSSRGIDGRVHVVQPVPPQEVVPFIRTADASVVLYYDKSINYQNALPNRFFQSIAAELPLVYPDLNEIRRLADRYGVGVMANPQNPAEIKLALQELIADDKRREAIRSNLRLASRDLCWEHEEKVLEALLRRHLGLAIAPASTVENKIAKVS